MPNPSSSSSPASSTTNFSTPVQATQQQTYKHRRTLSSEETTTQGTPTNRGWTKDYCTFDLTDAGGQHSFGPGQRGDVDIGIMPPPPATLTSRPFPRNIATTADEESYPARQPRTRHQSPSAILPSRSASRPDSQSLHRERGIDYDYMSMITKAAEGATKVEEKKGGIASWFTGSSAAVTMGADVHDYDSSSICSNMSSPEGLERAATFTELPTRKFRKRPTVSSLESTSTIRSVPPPPKASSAGGGSRFSFFSAAPKPVVKPPPPTFQVPANLNDEFLNLDIEAALFPSGAPSEQDPFSPAAFKNLLMNADGLLRKLQIAYKLRTLSLHELSQEKEAMREELEEAETRAQCLKNQLQGLGDKVSTQETTITDLFNELANEKKARAEEKEARLKSIALVHSLQRQHREIEKRASTASLLLDTTVEDTATPDRHSWRSSGASTQLSIETDSDVESAVESVFSRSMSPALTLDSAVSISNDTTPEVKQGNFTNLKLTRPKPTQQKSTFQKILGGMTGSGSSGSESGTKDMFDGIGMGDEGCNNCRGKNASVAWDTVGLLRAENKGLKDRVGELEGAVEGALRCCDLA